MLAERTVIKAKRWRDTATSTKISLPSSIDVKTADFDFESLLRIFSIDDWYPRYHEADSKIVSTISEHHYGTLRDPVVTICPYLAKKCDWRRSLENPLELHFSDGEVAAQTIRWIDGTDNLDVHYSDLFSEGQVLLLSKRAWDQLSKITQIAVHSKAQRKYISSMRGNPGRTVYSTNP